MASEICPSSSIAHALGDYAGSPRVWYENYPEVIPVTSDAQPIEVDINTEDSNVELQDATYPGFEKLQLIPYVAKGIFIPRATVLFLDETDKPTVLNAMLETIEREGWQEPWTNDNTVGHKMNLRVGLPGSPDEEVLEQNASLMFYVLDHRTHQEAIKKAKLGYNIAKSLKECKELTKFCKWKGYKFDDLALHSLVNVSQGSWQPALYVKV